MAQKYRLHHDFETWNRQNLTQVGTAKYVRDPSLEILMCAYAFDDEEVKQWVPAEGERMPSDLKQGLEDPDCVKFAWNKPFEQGVWEFGDDRFIPHDQWRDPMILAGALSLPMKLEHCGPIVGLKEGELKHTRGKALMRKFSIPSKPSKKHPSDRWYWFEDFVDWEEYKAYNKNDVVAERAIWKKLRPYNIPMHEWELWFLDQEINCSGIPVNMAMVDNCVKLVEDFMEAKLKRMAQITGLENPNSNPALLSWLLDNGYPFGNLQAKSIKYALEYIDNPPEHWRGKDRTYPDGYREVLELRQMVSKTSVKKFAALQRASDREDGVIRNTLQFVGAGRTWRWGGRIYQPQNLAKPTKEFEEPESQQQLVKHLEVMDLEQFEMTYSDPIGALSTAVRPVVQAPKGYKFADADLHAIENVVLGWMAQDEKILGVFESGRDPYIDFATYMYKESYDKLWHDYMVKKDKKKRTISKPGVLGCGYMLSAGNQYEDYRTGEISGTGLIGYALNMGVSLTPEEAELSVKTWRETFSDAVEFWWRIDRAARMCIRTGKPQECWPVVFDRKGPFMRMILPSDRALYYVRPRLEMWPMPWGEEKMSITYEGLNEKRQWERISTHPGKLTENADQAIARDFLANGMMLAKKEKLDIRIHVHDQIAALVGDDCAEEKLKVLIACMTETPAWVKKMGRKPIPLKASGMTTPIFIKD